MSIKDKVEERIKALEAKESLSDKDIIDPSFVMECLKNKSLGDGEIFKRLFRNEFVFNKAMDSWMFWTGHHWEIDKMGYALASVESVAKIYEQEAKRLYQKLKEIDDSE